MHVLHITLAIELLDEIFSLMMPTTLEYHQGSLVVPYMFSMSHNNSVLTKLKGELVLKCE
jgi:hypothetical protein